MIDQIKPLRLEQHLIYSIASHKVLYSNVLAPLQPQSSVTGVKSCMGTGYYICGVCGNFYKIVFGDGKLTVNEMKISKMAAC